MADEMRIEFTIVLADALIALIEKATKPALEESAFILENAYRAFSLAHPKGRVDTGTNARSVAAFSQQGNIFTATQSGYGIYIEHGTRKRLAAPTMLPALRKSTGEMAVALAGRPLPNADLTKGLGTRVIKTVVKAQ